MQGQVLIGWLLIALGTLSVGIGIAIGIKQYVFASTTGVGTKALEFKPIEILIGFLKALLKAPPAFFFVIVGCFLLVGGIRMTSGQPLLPSITGTPASPKDSTEDKASDSASKP